MYFIFPGQIYSDIMLNLAHALNLVKEIPCSGVGNENRLSSQCHTTALYALCTPNHPGLRFCTSAVLCNSTDLHLDPVRLLHALQKNRKPINSSYFPLPWG